MGIVKKLFGRLLEKINNLSQVFSLDQYEVSFINFSKKKWGSAKNSNLKPEMLMETQRYHPYLFRSSYLSNYFSKKYNVQIKSINSTWGTSVSYIYKYFYGHTALCRLLKSFGVSPGLNFYSLNTTKKDECRQQAQKVFDLLESKSDILKVSIKGIPVGDLIVDSYLRRLKLSTVDIKDKELLKIFQGAFEIFASCESYLEKHDVRLLLMSHAVYVDHGIIVRICLAQDIDVFVFTALDKQVMRRLSKDHYRQFSNHHRYKVDFAGIKNKKKALSYARENLEKRFSGVVDRGLTYMTQSAYANEFKTHEAVFKQNEKVRVVIFLHCFFDSPHIYHDMLFPDYHEWLDFTLSVLGELDVDVYVKPHPNGMAGNDRIIEHFSDKYSKANFLTKTVSNKQLIQEGFTAAVTVYGTLGHEFPYFGIPVIAAGDNPHVMYRFCNTAKTIDEYLAMLQNPEELNRDFKREEIEEFYYMHYLNEAHGRANVGSDWFGFIQHTQNYTQDSSILAEFIAKAERGEFDKIENYFETAYCHFNG